jgi:hypothetical protein
VSVIAKNTEIIIGITMLDRLQRTIELTGIAGLGKSYIVCGLWYIENSACVRVPRLKIVHMSLHRLGEHNTVQGRRR